MKLKSFPSTTYEFMEIESFHNHKSKLYKTNSYNKSIEVEFDSPDEFDLNIKYAQLRLDNIIPDNIIEFNGFFFLREDDQTIVMHYDNYTISRE